MHIIKILVQKISLFPLDYATETNHSVGELIITPFRNKEITGIVWEMYCSDSGKTLKSVKKESAFPARINNAMIELIKKN